ncbi:adenine phosphoribosyltransferase [Murinocardiopsis flavida]|uniref:Adenine phosphoribosyltransferase n=1 Tax=Murinocardiopsis flavida TaxID=645275 RepID=A0A2P8DKD4_9ACTN|nr:adenine phosphoribosyltransferase [Murinocardiopsis flavida]PSK97658.1 adenine phosphoribosyltransferase [Murinocardiopsis flavida]
MTPETSDLKALIEKRVRDVADFPEPGVVFKDITPLLGDVDAFRAVVDALGDGYGPIDAVAGLEARGFVFAAPVALALGAAFVPIRKVGKLPARTLRRTYDLEYGSATVEVHADAFTPGARVLIVDDVLATGGTARAAADLVREAGGTVVGFSVVMELAFLNGRDRLTDVPLRALTTV